MRHLSEKETPLRQFDLNGEKVYYDACSSKELEEAKKDYDNFEYIGSGKIYYINGTRNESKTLHHFFTRKF